jgi:uncharacterized membrane protein YfcA
MDFTPVFYHMAIIVILLTGMDKGGFARGMGTMAVPALALLVDPRVAAAIMLPILCCMDLVTLRAFRGQWDIKIVRVIVPAAALGIALGTLSFRYLSADHIRFIIGTLSIYVAVQQLPNSAPINKGLVSSPSKLAARIWGAASGFSSFIAHAGGPPLSIYLLPLRLDKTIVVGTSALFFAIVNALKLIPYALLGQLHFENLKVSLILLPVAPIGVLLGVFLHRRISNHIFYFMSYSMLGIIGIKLILESLI